MIGKVLLACLLCVVLATCAMGRPGGCRDKSSAASPGSSRASQSLVGLLRRSAAIASSLRNLRSVRQRRWSRSYPLWKSLHKIKERAMDISGLPPLPVPDPDEVARGFEETHALVDKDLGGMKLGWQDTPFAFPGLPPQPAATGGDEEPSDDWGAPLDFPGLPDDHEHDWGEFIEPCSDDIVGNPCTHNSDCPGCGVFHCSTSTHRCVAGEEPDPNFGGFF